MPQRHIQIAHSPDTDDIFMFYALKTGRITHPDYSFDIIGRDIEELNQEAVHEVYDISAISMHAYAHLSDKYALLASGASVAEQNYGPLVVARQSYELKDLQDRIIGVPGQWTTAFLLLKMALPNVKFKILPPIEILQALSRNEIDAGLIIHEGQLQFQDLGFHVVHRVIDTWRQIAGDKPLPLGASAVKKSLGPKIMKDLADLQLASIQYALEHRQEAIDYCLKVNPVLTRAAMDHYLSWYVNHRTVDLGVEGEAALRLLFDEAFARELLPKRVTLEMIR